MCSYIKISREVLEQFRYKPNVKLVYICLVENAQVKDFQINGKTLHRGDVMMSVAQISKQTGLTPKQVRTALDTLKKGKHLGKQRANERANERANNTPILTICNYDCYEDFENKKGKQEDKQDGNKRANERATKEEIIINKKYINISPLYPPLKSGEGNEKILESENLKNQTSLKAEKEKEKKYTAPAKKEKEKFVKPTIEEIAEYCKERNNNVDANIFFDFYESKGWVVGKNPMKDWKASVRTWEKNRNQNNYNNGNNTTDYRDFRKYVSPTTDYGQSTI